MELRRSGWGGYVLEQYQRQYHIISSNCSDLFRVEKGVGGALLYEDKSLENCIEWILEQEEE